MEFSFEMNYNRQSMTAMAKAVRCGLQNEQDKKSKLIGWFFVIMTFIILLSSGRTGWPQLLAGVVIACLAVYLVFTDYINGILALWKLPKDLRKGEWLFREDGYFSNAQSGECDYSYENIFAIVESDGYIVLVFHNGQAQILNANTIKGGTLAEFRKLLRKKTNLTIQNV